MSEEVTPKRTTTAAWKKSATHTVRCPSGVWVDIRIPDLPALIEAGSIPQHLLDAALETVSQGAQGVQATPTKELIIQQREFTDKLVQLTVVDPKLSDEDVRDVPYEDKEMLVDIATRRVDFDAEGNHLGGLHTSAQFRAFRRLERLDPALSDL